MVNITHVDLLALAVSIPYANQLTAITNASVDEIHFLSYHKNFTEQILGPHVSQELITKQEYDAFHEAGVYNIETGSLYVTSNYRIPEKARINITAVRLSDNSISSFKYDQVAEANGGAPFYPVGSDPTSSEGQQVIYCDEGDFVNPSQLVLVDPAKNTSRVLINNFLGRNFSSINDVEQHYGTGDLWFTDARYGYWQYFRPEPVIRPQVYRFEPLTGVVQAVADDFVAPNGIEFSPDFKHVYVTDTGRHTFPDKDNLTDPTTIYRFDVTADGKRLHNRQVFAYVSNGFPDGIHTDVAGNVYSGCGDGVQVWNPSGVLLGKIGTSTTVNNFAFVPGGMYIFNAYRLWKVTLKAEGRAVKRDFGLYKKH